MVGDPTLGGILTLDLARVTGWAYGPAGARPQVFGAWDLGPATNGHGVVLAGLADHIGDAFKLHRPSLVVMEAPLPPQAQTSANTARLMLGYCAIVELLCYRWEIAVREARAPEVRKAVIGRANGLDKKAIVAWCRGKGYAITDHNTADAVVLWHYASMMRAGNR